MSYFRLSRLEYKSREKLFPFSDTDSNHLSSDIDVLLSTPKLKGRFKFTAIWISLDFHGSSQMVRKHGRRTKEATHKQSYYNRQDS